MTAKYTVIDSQVLSTSAASVTFSSIPGGYKDLVLIMSPLSLTASVYGGAALITFNGDTGSNYSYVFMRGNGSTTASSSGTTTAIYGGYQTNSSYHSSFQCSIQDYSATDKHKSTLNRDDTAENATYARAYRWANTAAITSIEITGSGGSFATGSTFHLLGVN